MSSKFRTSYFKKMYFLGQTRAALGFSGQFAGGIPGIKISQDGSNFAYNDAIRNIPIKFGFQYTWLDIASSEQGLRFAGKQQRQDMRNKNSDFQLEQIVSRATLESRKSFAPYLDRDNGVEFVAKALLAKALYDNGQKEEMYWLSQIMIAFYATYKNQFTKASVRGWEAIDYEKLKKTTGYKSYPDGPWIKPIWYIFTSFDETGLWDTIFDTISKTPQELGLPWASAPELSKQFYNSFFLVYDEDNGGLSFKEEKDYFAAGSRPDATTLDTVKTTVIEQYNFLKSFVTNNRNSSRKNGFPKYDGGKKRWMAVIDQLYTPAFLASSNADAIRHYTVNLSNSDLNNFRAKTNDVLQFFKDFGLYDLDSVVAELYKKASEWKKVIGNKARKIIADGLFLSDDFNLFCKYNFNDDGFVPQLFRKWDKRAHQRMGYSFLYYDNSFGPEKDPLGYGYVSGYTMSTNLNKQIFKTGLQNKNVSKVKDNGQREFDGRIHQPLTANPKRQYAPIMDETKYNQNKEAIEAAFNDGYGKGNANTPWVAAVGANPAAQKRRKSSPSKSWYKWNKDDGNSEVSNTGDGNTKATPTFYKNVISDDYFKTNAPDVTRVPVPIPRYDTVVWHYIKNSDPFAQQITTYDRMVSYLDDESRKIQLRTNESPYQADFYYAYYAKQYCLYNIVAENTLLHFPFGKQIFEIDESTGQQNILNNTLANAYKEFAKEVLAQNKKSAEGNNGKTQGEIFSEVTSWLAYSLAGQVLCYHRDQIVFDLMDQFFKQVDVDQDQTFTKSELESELDSIDDRLTKSAEDAIQAGAADGEELDEEEIKNRQIFYKQCFLLMNMQELGNAYMAEMTQDVKGGASRTPIHTGGNEFNGRIRMVNKSSLDDDSVTVMNRVLSPKGSEINAFFDARPELISALVPQIKLFRVSSELDSNGDSRLHEIELDFPKFNSANKRAYKADQGVDIVNKNGTDVEVPSTLTKNEFGITEFTFDFQGTSPATARNDIKAKLGLFFRDFNDLIKERTLNEFSMFKNQSAFNQGLLENKKNKYRYLDLILFPGSVHKGHQDQPFDYNPSQFRIRADVGWVMRDGYNSVQFQKLCEASDTTPQLLNIALSKINKSFYLNMIDHNLDFAADGSVNIDIEYRAYMESATKSISLDVLATPEVNTIRKNLQSELNSLYDLCTPEQLREVYSTYKTIETELTKKSYQSIITRLIRRRRLLYTYSSYEDREEFRKLGYFAEQPTLHRLNGATVATVGTEAELVAADNDGETVANSFSLIDGNLTEYDPNVTNPNNNAQKLEIVNYFFIGDLFYTLMDCMYEAPAAKSNKIVGKIRNDVKNTLLMLSSFKYQNPLQKAGPSELKEINIAEIPVALDYFLEFMTKNVIEEGRRSYPLMYFIRDFCNRLIVDLMNDICVKNLETRNQLRFNTASLLALPKSTNGPDPLFEVPFFTNQVVRNVTIGYKRGDLPFITTLENRSINEAFNYISIYPVSSTKYFQGRGIRSEDEQRGVRHLYIGRPRGLVKTIKFSKVDMQYLREARYFNHGYNGLMQLGAVYRASIEMIGNTNFYPGMTVFINPVSLSIDGMDPTVGPNSPDGPSVANALGIGGYFLIDKVNNAIGIGKFTTTVSAIFVYAGDGLNPNISNPKQKVNQKNAEDEEEQITVRPATPPTAVQQDACREIIKVRQAMAANPFSEAFQGDLVTGKDPSDIKSTAEQAQQKAAAEGSLLREEVLEAQRKAAEQQAKELAEEIRQQGIQ